MTDAIKVGTDYYIIRNDDAQTGRHCYHIKKQCDGLKLTNNVQKLTSINSEFVRIIGLILKNTKFRDESN